jgi:HAD superfamily hydrolase (TIGR01459 family)
LCTGLFDDKENNLDYYKDLLKKYTSKKLICTNPDLTVHRGDIEEYCAGSIAKIFESLGGETVYFGKPYKEIYKMCFSKEEKVIAIGDNLNTDIKGANEMKIDSIFISNGVHRSEFTKEDELSELSKKYKVKFNYYQPELIW